MRRGAPRFVRVEAFGIKDAFHYMEKSLVPYLVACGAQVEGSSSDRTQVREVDDPQQSLDNPRRRQDEYLGASIEAYEHGVA